MDEELVGGATRGDHLAFLLRIWRENDRAPWRASLQSPQAGGQLGFASLDELFAFLQRQLGLRAGPHPDSAGREGMEDGSRSWRGCGSEAG